MKSTALQIGKKAPAFTGLLGTDGKKYSLSNFDDKKVLVVVFSCNHCPYVQAYEERMIAFQDEYGKKSVQLLAINANETENYPEDNYEGMVLRAQRKGFNFPYLRDDDQAVASAFGATHTPEFFVFDEQRNLRYYGRMDDNFQDPAAVTVHYLKDAVNAILAGKEVPIAETHSIGCTIKWK